MLEPTLSAEKEELPAKNSFLPGKSKQEVEEIFRQKRKHKILSLGTHEEKIKVIGAKSRPLGLFTFKKRRGDKVYQKQIFVDLNSGEIYSLKGANLKRDPILKKILELPLSIQEDLLHLIEHKSFDCEDFPKKHLSILEKKGLVYLTSRQKKSFLVSLTDHFLDVITALTDVMGGALNMKPTKSSTSETSELATSRAIINFKPLNLDRSYNLNFYLENDKYGRVSKEFEPDKINHQPQEIKDILRHILSSEGEVEFKEVVYLPYYKCHYTNLHEREALFFPLKFKSFTSHFIELDYFWLYNLIDKVPELPFLFLASLYAAYIYPNLSKIALVFSSSFIFVLLALIVGSGLKLGFKKERKVPYFTDSIMRYGFPSLHALTSLGAISFVFFIPELGPYLSLALIPLGFLYIYSRLKLKVHSLVDVVGGGVIGLLLGAICGYSLLSLNILSLNYSLELVLAFLFFIFPIFSILYRIKAEYLP